MQPVFSVMLLSGTTEGLNQPAKLEVYRLGTTTRNAAVQVVAKKSSRVQAAVRPMPLPALPRAESCRHAASN